MAKTTIEAQTITEVVTNDFANKDGLLGFDTATKATVKVAKTSRIKAHMNDFPGGSIPLDSEIVGVELQVIHKNPNITNEDLPYLFEVPRYSGWVQAIDLLPGDFLEVDIGGNMIKTTQGEAIPGGGGGGGDIEEGDDGGGEIGPGGLAERDPGEGGWNGTHYVHFAFPEGFYSAAPRLYDHVNNPGAVDVTAASFPTNYTASNTPPFAATIVVLPVGDPAPTATISNALYAARSKVFTPEELDIPEGGGTVWICYNWKLFAGEPQELLQSGQSFGSFMFLMRRRPTLTSQFITSKQTYTVPINQEATTQAGSIAANEYLEIFVDGRGIWDGFKFMHPEGSYWDTWGSYIYDPCGIDPTRPIGSGWFATNTPPFGIDMAIRTTGQGQPAHTISNGYTVKRFQFFDPSKVTPGNLWFVANDVTGTYIVGGGADNEGEFRVTIRKHTRPDPVPNTTRECLLLETPPYTPGDTPGAGVVDEPGLSGESRIEVQLWKNAGLTLPFGPPRLANTLSGFWQMTRFGSVGDLWGRTVAESGAMLSEINSGLYATIRRPNFSDEELNDTRDYAGVRLLIYHNSLEGSLMVERHSVKQRIHFGKESTFGEAVAAPKRLLSGRINPVPDAEFREHRPQGNKLASHYALMREHATSSLEGIPTYDEMGYFLASVIAAPVASGTGVAGTRNRHEFIFNNQGETLPVSYTFEYGNNASRAHKVKGAVFNEFGVSFERGVNAGAEMTGNMFSHAIADGITMGNGATEVQTVTITATGGSFFYRFKGVQAAASILYNANAAAHDTSLESLSSIGASGIAVTGTGPFTVTFSGTGLAGLAQPLLEIVSDPADPLTGGTVTVTTTTQGGVTELPLVEILPGQVSVYMADTYAGLAAGKLTRAHLVGFAVTDRWGPYWTLGGNGGDSFIDVVELPVSARFNLSLQADSNGMGLLGTARNGAAKFVRVEAIGPLIAGSDNHKFILEACVKVAALGTFEDDDGIYQVDYELASVEDAGTGLSFKAVLENGLIAY